MGIITDIASSPAVAVPLGTTTAVANLVTILPVLINVAMLIYLIILIAHKIWTWYKERQGKMVINTKDEIP